MGFLILQGFQLLDRVVSGVYCRLPSHKKIFFSDRRANESKASLLRQQPQWVAPGGFDGNSSEKVVIGEEIFGR